MANIGRSLSRGWVGIVFVVAACNHGNYIGAIGPKNDAAAMEVGTAGVDTGIPSNDGGPSLHPPGPVTAVYTDLYTSCAVVDPGGRLYCWGYDYPLATGASLASLTATPRGIDNVQQVTASCVLFRDGTVSCWNGDSPPRLVPVPNLNHATQIVTGDCHCALIDDGTVRCWGDNSPSAYADCAVATGSTTALAPVAVPGLSNVVQIAGGIYFVCARRVDGTVWCWGSNRFGQLGDGGGPSSAAPKQVGLATTAKAIATNPYLACGVLDNGQVSCWGSWDPCLALECGGPTPMRPTALTRPGATVNGAPAPVTGAVDIALENRNLCLLENDPGAPEYQFLDCMQDPGTYSQYPPYLQALTGSNYSHLDISVTHGCALKDDGEVYCWGDNGSGAVGSGQIGEIWPQPNGVHW
jgi:Regulator of Chromosome Condensation (RCC1) repeat protein